MKDFRKLKVWEKAHAVTLQVYKLTSLFPGRETFGLIAQMRGASVSIASNLAEAADEAATPNLVVSR